MINYKQFVKNNIEEDVIAFTYNAGGDEQTVIITGSKSQIKKVENKLPSSTKIIDADVVKSTDAWEISASEWLKIK